MARTAQKGQPSPRGRGRGAGELVGDGGAVVGVQRVPAVNQGMPLLLGGPGTGHTEHRPAAADDLTLGVLLGAEGDDGGLTTAGESELG